MGLCGGRGTSRAGSASDIAFFFFFVFGSYISALYSGYMDKGLVMTQKQGGIGGGPVEWEDLKLW